MKYTSNLNLRKPDGTDVVNIEDLNANMDILDVQVAGKVDKAAGKGLSTEDYTPAEKTKLAGIAAGANNYVHPATHSPGIIAQDANNRFVTDTEKSAWNAKAGTALATTSANGLMSSTDKSKLDGVEAGAQKNTVTSVNTRTGAISLTKSDVGLSSVANYDIATEAEARTAAVNTKYMTPLRVKQTIESNFTAKRTSRFVIGTSAAGWGVNDCDYLCDGVDDQVEINAAISALPTGGGEIVILDGTYNITGEVLVNINNASIQGNGNATILKKMWDTSTAEVIKVSANYCKICNLIVDGNYKITGSDISVSGSNNTITGNTCTYSVKGISVSGSSNTIADNTCNNSINYGILIDSTGSSNTITGNTCKSGSGIGIAGSNNTIVGNTCNNSNNFGILVDSTGSNNTITGNTCYNNIYGIEIRGINNNITGNTCIRGTGQPTDYSSNYYPIRCTGSNNLISSNMCMGKALANTGIGNLLINNKES